MKKFYTLIFTTILLTQTAFGQGKVDYNNKWFIGINAGGTYHSNTEVDVNNLYRGGAGFTFGKSYHYERGNLISWDLRFRYLIAAYRGLAKQTYALDSTNTNILNYGDILKQYEQAYGKFNPNFHSWVSDASIELQLNTNYLRQKTGWNLFVFGGLGITSYKTSIDLYEDDVSFNIKDEVDFDEKGVFFSDYETRVQDKVTWMPSLGAGFSKQLSPNVAFEVLGRMTWTRNNDFDAMPYNMDGSISTTNDRYHYASAGFKFNLGNGEAETHTNNTHTNNNNVNNNGSVTPKVQKPIVDFTKPNTTPHITHSPSYQIKANVFYVEDANHVVFKQDNMTNGNFSYNANTDIFVSNVMLHLGENKFTIKGTNEHGSDEETIIIIYNQEVTTVKKPPIVTITNPASSGTVVQNPAFNFKAKVLHVTGKQSITLNFNGINTTNFTYSTNSKVLKANLILNTGTNVVTVTGVNNDGSDFKTTKIIYRKPREVQPPIVSFINPSSTPKNVNVNTYALIAQVLYVDSKNNITVKINGHVTSNFTFNNATHIVNMNLVLNSGNNTIEIKGTNQDGQDIKSTVLVYKKQVTQLPPVVKISYPSADNQVFSTPNLTVLATVFNVVNASGIQVKFNGIITTNFTYNPSTKVVTLPVTLNTGSNSVLITGTNSVGSDSKTRIIVYKRKANPVLMPPTVIFTNPAISPQTVTNELYTMTAQTTCITSKSQIVFKVNGVVIPGSQYGYNNSQINYSTTLMTGSTLFDIVVTNASGSDQKNATVILEENEPCTAPTIGYISPQPNSTVTDQNTIIETQINNFIAGTSIQIVQNGNIIGTMAFNAVTSIASKNVSLVEGNNMFIITVSNDCGTNTSTFSIILKKANVPCIEPTITAIGNTTISTDDIISNVAVNVTNISNSSQISVKNNGTDIPFSFSGAINTITINGINLTAGLNTIKIEVTNDCGTDVLNYTITRIVCETPTIIIENENNTSSNVNYLVSAILNNVENTSDITVKLNGVIKAFIFNSQTKILESNLTLIEGENIIIIKIDGCEIATKTITINYTAPCLAPVIQIISVNKVVAGQTMSGPIYHYDLTANVTNVNGVSDITVLANGKNLNPTFDLQTGVLTASFAVKDGDNTYSITAVGCQTTTVNETVNENGGNDCDPPVITLISSQTATSSVHVFKANVTNIDNASDVTVKHNGTVVNSTLTNGEVKAYLTLTDGDNTISVIANGCETVTTDFVVNFELPCDTPTISITSDTIVTSSTFYVTANITGLLTQANVSVEHNGGMTQIGWVDFNKNLHQLAATINLVDGENIIVITLEGCETVTETIIINYEAPCEVPAINLTSSNSVTESVYSLIGTITNIGSSSDVIVKLNGVTANASYNVSTNILAAGLTLVEGSNTIKVTAKGCETSTKIFIVELSIQNNNDSDDDDDNGHTNSKLPLPKISIITPSSNNKTVNSSSMLFKSQVLNITSKSQITITLNNVRLTSFLYSKSTHQLSAVLRLKNGTNVVKITAVNSEGTVSSTTTIIYRKSDTNTNKPSGKPSSGKVTKPSNNNSKGKPSSGKVIKPSNNNNGKQSGSKTNVKPSGGSKSAKPTNVKNGSSEKAKEGASGSKTKPSGKSKPVTKPNGGRR